MGAIGRNSLSDLNPSRVGLHLPSPAELLADSRGGMCFVGLEKTAHTYPEEVPFGYGGWMDPYYGPCSACIGGGGGSVSLSVHYFYGHFQEQLIVKRQGCRPAPVNLRPWSSDGKGWNTHFRWEGSFCPKWSIWGSSSQRVGMVGLTLLYNRQASRQ